MPHIVWDSLLDFFAVLPVPAMLDAMKSRSAMHSKNGGVFSGDPQEAKAVSDDPCASIQPHYEELERLRLKQKLFRLG